MTHAVSFAHRVCCWAVLSWDALQRLPRECQQDCTLYCSHSRVSAVFGRCYSATQRYDVIGHKRALRLRAPVRWQLWSVTASEQREESAVDRREQKVAPPMPSGPERINLPPASVSFDIKEPPCTGRTKLPTPRRLLTLLAVVGRDARDNCQCALHQTRRLG